MVAPRYGPVRALAKNDFDAGRWREVLTLDTTGLAYGQRAAFTPDGAHILVWSSGEARLFAAPERGAALAETARRTAPRCLSVAERQRAFLDPTPPRWCITGVGLEDETDPQKWDPVSPYRTLTWRKWQIAADQGNTPPLPRAPTDE